MVESMLIGRFRIGNRLGAGTFGETFLAQDTQKMNAQCVVKRLIPPDDPAHINIVRQMFDKEAKKLDALNHQGIPKLIAYFENGGEFYLVQDFVDGNTLDKEINRSRKWTEVEVNNFLLEVLEVLAYVHSQGSIHRDLKPNNMMRRKVNKKLVLIDFGAVREVRQTTTNMAIGLASGTIAIGTLGYMPAEQAQGRPCYASDVYAIGCMAIEALIGVSPYPPYGFDTDVNTGEFRWRHRAQVSDGLAAIIDKMVRYDWRQRYVNGGAALAALQGLASNQARSVPNPLPVKPVPKNPPANRLQTQTLNNIITVNANGQEVSRTSSTIQYFTESLNLPNGAVPLEMALIPKGKFTMGSPSSEESPLNNESPQHEVNFPQEFYMGRYAVTQAQWLVVMQKFTDEFNERTDERLNGKFKGDNRPMIYVSLHEAREFCKRLTALILGDRGFYRLPTEAEWEYACRAGTTTPFHFGETITPSLVSYNGHHPYANAPKGGYRQQTVDVNSFMPNLWGLYQMHGNVWEWCLDEFLEYSKKTGNLKNNGSEPYGDMNVNDNDRSRLARGGSFVQLAALCRSACRSRLAPCNGMTSKDIGFRIVFSSLS